MQCSTLLLSPHYGNGCDQRDVRYPGGDLGDVAPTVVLRNCYRSPVRLRHCPFADGNIRLVNVRIVLFTLFLLSASQRSIDLIVFNRPLVI